METTALPLAPAAPELDPAATAFVLLCAALVLLMTPALAIFYGGMTRAKSVLNMMMMSFGAMGVVGVIYVLFGYSMSFGPNDVAGIMANPFYVDMGYTKDEVAAVTKIYGVIMTLVGAALGGVLVMRFGTLRILFLGAVLTAIINFLLIAAVIYFLLVAPMNKLDEATKRRKGIDPEEPEPIDTELLTEIRDLLAGQNPNNVHKPLN